MTATSDTPQHQHRRLRLREVADLDDTAFSDYLQDRFDNLVTAAIADAASYLRPAQHDLLHAPDRLHDLRDALTFAEGDLQVAVERMTYRRDPRAARTTRQLRQVRTARHQVHRETADLRRAEDRTREAAAVTPSTDTVTTARGWLAHAYPARFAQLLAQAHVAAGLPARPLAKDIFDTIEEGWADGHLTAPITPGVEHLLAKGVVAVRSTVADDARDQNNRDPALRHPLLQRRWNTALEELVSLTVPVARASSPSALGALPRDFSGLPEQDAFKILNARRFLVAIWQRRAEHTRLVHQYAGTVTERRRAAPDHDLRSQALDETLDRLVAEHPAAAARILARLRPYATADGRLEEDVFTPALRAQAKREVLADLAAIRRPDVVLPSAIAPRRGLAATAALAAR
ncbi:hypothetical protein ABZ128_03665 [Streptomyces sp. NPDC006326]|uniref:hypothetical protein n=1 Tax=Streptomyces sp. NPDC006326 TaxID=3156752 RepID=UPI0033A0BCF1